MKISVAVLGNVVEVEVANGSNVVDALATFERVSGKLIQGMDFYKDGTKIADLGGVNLQDGDKLVAIKSKHESASGIKISVKVLGNKFEVECDGQTDCADALATFERVTGKAMQGMDLYRNGSKLAPSDTLADGDEVVAIKSKHESA